MGSLVGLDDVLDGYVVVLRIQGHRVTRVTLLGHGCVLQVHQLGKRETIFNIQNYRMIEGNITLEIPVQYVGAGSILLKDDHMNKK